MSELVRSVGLLSSQRAVVLVLGAVRTKVAASMLGPAGMGLLAQAMALRELLASLSTLGTRSGYLKLVAESHGRDDREALARIIVTTIMGVSILALIMAVAAASQAPRVAQWAFGDPGQAVLVLLVALTVVVAMPAKLLARTFMGVLDYRTYFLIAMVESVAAVGAMALLAHFFGVVGAVASFAVVEVLALTLGGWLLWRRLARPLGLRLREHRPDPAVVRRLMRLAGALAITSLAASGALVFVRAEILRGPGAQANGYYQVAWQVGQNYLALIGAALWGYGMPKVATRVDDPGAIAHLQNNFLRMVVAFLVPGVIVLLATRPLWIPILFSEAFLLAAGPVAWQLVGELLAMSRQSMNISLLPRERLRFLIFQALFYWGLWAGLSTWLLADYGASAAAMAYLAANALALIVTATYHHRVLHYRVDAENRRLLAVAVPGLLVGISLATQESFLVGGVAPVLLALALLWLNRGVLQRLRNQSVT